MGIEREDNFQQDELSLEKQEEIIKLETKEDKNELFEPLIPRGWTILKHGTNLLRWGEINPYNSESIKVKNPLSVITQEEFNYMKGLKGNYDTTKSYANNCVKPEEIAEGEFQEKNKPFEIRILFYKNHARGSDDLEYKQGLSEETIDEIGKYYFANRQGGRHPLVPTGETLIKIGQTKENNIDVFYFITESTKEAYLKESGFEIEKLKSNKEKNKKIKAFRNTNIYKNARALLEKNYPPKLLKEGGVEYSEAVSSFEKFIDDGNENEALRIYGEELKKSLNIR